MRVISIFCLLCCVWQIAAADSKLNFEEADVALRLAGMKADGSVHETQQFIEQFAITTKELKVQREISILQELAKTNWREFPSVNEVKSVGEKLKSIQSSEKVSGALKMWAKSTQDTLADAVMKNLVSPISKKKYLADYDYLNSIQSRFRYKSQIRQPWQLSYGHVLKTFNGYDKYGIIDFKETLAMLHSYNKLVGSYLRALQLDSYPIDNLLFDNNKGIYGAYLTSEKIKYLEADMQKFIESKSGLEKDFLRKLESSMSFGFFEKNDSDLKSKQIAALAKNELKKPEIIKSLGIDNESAIVVEAKLKELLAKACEANWETSKMFALVSFDKNWDLPIRKSLEAVGSMCYWTQMEHKQPNRN